MARAPKKDLVLLPSGGYCAVLMQPDLFLAELRPRYDQAGISPPGALRVAKAGFRGRGQVQRG